ncbi:hypothetical protein D5086_024819 [Populus alba]|uniref:Uncharacterized protein n=1 Tax=Populus alba TaxID=43335 RepID=A0ACC4B7D7_POPAL
MTILVVEVHDACDLMPKDGHGSASPYVQVDFDEQSQRTQTKPQELNPIWNEKLVFKVRNPRDLPNKTIEVVVYNDRKGGHHKNFLGCVRISGISVPLLSDSEAIDPQRYPLDKRGPFSHVKGDIALKIYAAHDGSHPPPPPPPPPTNAGNIETEATPVFQEIKTTMLQEDVIDDHEKKKKKKNKDKEVRTFHTIGTATAAPAAAPAPSVSTGFGFQPQVMKEKAPTVETRTDFARAGPPTAMSMQMPRQNPEFLLVETSPPLAARMRYRGWDKMASTYDLVEQMHYLYVSVVKARDLPVMDVSGSLDPYVEVKLGNYKGKTKFLEKNQNPVWTQIFAFAKDRLQSNLLEVTVKDKDFGKDDFVGRVFFDLSEVPLRVPPDSPLAPQWPSFIEEGDKKKDKFSSKILLCLCLDAGYHVLDESTHFSSDLQPSSKHLRKQKIGILELGILSARNLLPLKGKDGRTTDAYCVSKYGNKWVRTRTILDTLNPRWNEQYTWDVYDPCTVITIGVFDNCHINGSKEDARDQRIGKVRIRLSTLETDRIYTHYYPLLVLTHSGLKKHGELHLAIRFTCIAWVNMLAHYGKPLLPKMHYYHPISVRHIDWLRHQAMQIVAARLSRSEPPLRREAVEYMLDVDYHMWSLRRSKANVHRMMSMLSGVTAVCKWFNDICYWRNPITTCLVHVLFFILVCYPELILPTIFLYLFVIGLWNYRFRPRHPPHMDARLSQADNAHPDELDEEFETFPASRPSDIVRMRYDRMRSVAGRVQTVVGDLASQGERAQALLSWRDPRATAIFILFSLIGAILIYVTLFQVVAVLVGLYVLRHPRFRSRMPSVPVNFFKRLPSRADMLL